MPLSITRQPQVTASNGAAGPNGAAGATPGADGADATAGGNGRAAAFLGGPETFTGDDGNDSVYLFARATGGTGGLGGLGGGGALPASTVVINQTPSLLERIQTYTAAGDGGDGGDGGRGGAASAIYSGLLMNLAGGSDTVSIRADAYGGFGNFGGAAGSGANGAGNSFGETYQGPSTNPGASVLRSVTIGAPGALPGLAGDGGAGGKGTAAIRDVDIEAATVSVALGVYAYGRPGYAGGNASSGGVGTTGAPGADGGKGGNGGAALAEVTGLDVSTTGRLTLTVDIRAEGGNAGNGASGAAGNYAYAYAGRTDNTGSTSLTSYTYAAHGEGGDGGAGGRAEARFADSAIAAGAENDSVTVFMAAQAGLGGKGGNGYAATASSTTVNGGHTTTITGTPASLAGLDGRNGAGGIVIQNVGFDLGAGNDSLVFDLRPASGARVTASGSRLDGGAGTDTLALGAAASGPAAVVDLLAGTLRLGAGTVANTLTGFEIFVGSLRNDRFIDGAGDQRYNGNGGADRFDFRPGHGDDTVLGFAAGDTLRLLGFGSSLNSFAEVQAVTTQTAQGALIDTGGGTSILLQGVAAASLAADMFGFG